MAKAIMILGTASGVGKTVFCLALCRIFAQDGYRVSPFKALNVTTNTTFAADGGEIALSQHLQALAAGVPTQTDMNPLVLKIPSMQQTEVIRNGKPFHVAENTSFRDLRPQLITDITAAYKRLAAAHDIVVIEGAGSPVELNLKQDDIVNMEIARQTAAPALLVADIDRGGAFAALHGTLTLLDPAERAHVKACVINRFQGNPADFDDGRRMLEELTALPVVGVIPHMPIHLPEEDDLFTAQTKPLAPTALDAEFNRIANTVRSALDLDLIYRILQEGVS